MRSADASLFKTPEFFKRIINFNISCEIIKIPLETEMFGGKIISKASFKSKKSSNEKIDQWILESFGNMM